MKLLKNVITASLLVSLISCNTFRFEETRFRDEANSCWWYEDEESCIADSDPILLEEYVLVRQDEVIHLYEDYVCRLKEGDSTD